MYSEDKFKEIIKYIDFPNHLKGRYQNYTLAKIDSLRKVGFNYEFLNIQEGISKYMKELKDNMS